MEFQTVLSNKVRLLFVNILVVFALAACGGARAQEVQAPRDQANGAQSGGIAEVHMNDTRFVPETITIRQGESINLIADTVMPHFIANGSWQNGAARPALEPGAPKVDTMRIDGNSSGLIGPFNTAGAFQFYCTIHQGMNLTVVVE
jgi:plastocyanin